MARTPKRLAGPAQLTTAAATKITVPSTCKSILRHIHFYNADTVARLVTLSIGNDAAATRLLDGYSIPAGSPYDHYCYHVVDGAEVVQALADAASKVTLTINGDEISLG